MEDDKIELSADKVDADKLRLKLHPGERGPEKIQAASNTIKVVVVAVVALFILVGVALCQMPKKVEGPPKACFKNNVCLDLILSTTPAQQELGLTGYDSLPQEKGMLFVFSKVGPQQMWTKDMQFPVDIFWLDEKGKILNIEKKAMPCTPDMASCEIFEPAAGVKYVLETNAGFAIDSNLYDGDKVDLQNIPTAK